MAARHRLPGYTVSAELIHGLIECAVKCGLSRAELADPASDAGASAATTEPERYSHEHLLKLWERITRLSGDPIIGHRMALRAEPKTFGVLGQILRRCATVFDAYRQVERHSIVLYQGTRVAVARDRNTLAVSAAADFPDGAAHRNAVFWILTNLSSMPRSFAGVQARPKSVECVFEAPPPAAARVLRERWPIKFDAGVNRIVFDGRVADAPIPSADTDLKTLLAQVIERRLKELGDAASFEEGLMTILRRMMNGSMPTLAGLSAHAGMSQRTLQRRLAESGTSFQRLLRQVLREASDELLARGALSQGEIAFLLGYSEESAFSRAYRSWTGQAPGAARARTATAG